MLQHNIKHEFEWNLNQVLFTEGHEVKVFKLYLFYLSPYNDN